MPQKDGGHWAADEFNPFPGRYMARHLNLFRHLSLVSDPFSLPCHLQFARLPSLMLCTSIFFCQSSFLFYPACHVILIYKQKFDWKSNSPTFFKPSLSWAAIIAVVAQWLRNCAMIGCNQIPASPICQCFVFEPNCDPQLLGWILAQFWVAYNKSISQMSFFFFRTFVEIQ